jgi:hypothetical protein
MFLAMHLKYVSVMILVNQTETPKLWEIVHENGPKMQNYKIWSCHSKLVLSILGLVNHLGTPKLWAIAHENGHKCKNDEFLVMSLKHVLSVMGLVNQPRTPKLWAIAHENSPKMQKQLVFGHATQTCTTCHRPCKSTRNPKTVGNSS